MRVVLLDNRDSFVYNLVDQFASLGAEIEVYRNNAPVQTVLQALEPTAQEQAAGMRPVLCLSPGPGHPSAAGCLMELVLSAIERQIPTLGICLGFQAIIEAVGGVVEPVGPVHGRSVRVIVTQAGREDPAFVPLHGAPLDVARYHSLGTRWLPEGMICLAHSHDMIGMASRHKQLPLVGLQFHPESVLTPHGPEILRGLITDLSQGQTPYRPTDREETYHDQCQPRSRDTSALRDSGAAS